MSDRTKLILAITLGSVGLALGVLATMVAFNARNEVQANQEVTTVVEEKFAEAQKRQDELEASQVSDAEKLVGSLSRSQRIQLREVNRNASGISTNAAAISSLQKRQNKQAQEISSLESGDQQLSSQLADLQKQVQRNFNQLSDRIDGLMRQVNRLQVEVFP